MVTNIAGLQMKKNVNAINQSMNQLVGAVLFNLNAININTIPMH